MLCYEDARIIHSKNKFNSTYFHSMTLYSVTFWGNSTDSKKYIKTQNKVIRIIEGNKKVS
jgi:hypothetical protein